MIASNLHYKFILSRRPSILNAIDLNTFFKLPDEINSQTKAESMLNFGKERKLLIVPHARQAFNSVRCFNVVNVTIFWPSKAEDKTTGSIRLCF